MLFIFNTGKLNIECKSIYKSLKTKINYKKFNRDKKENNFNYEIQLTIQDIKFIKII